MLLTISLPAAATGDYVSRKSPGYGENPWIACARRKGTGLHIRPLGGATGWVTYAGASWCFWSGSPPGNQEENRARDHGSPHGRVVRRAPARTYRQGSHRKEPGVPPRPQHRRCGPLEDRLRSPGSTRGVHGHTPGLLVFRSPYCRLIQCLDGQARRRHERRGSVHGCPRLLKRMPASLRASSRPPDPATQAERKSRSSPMARGERRRAYGAPVG